MAAKSFQLFTCLLAASLMLSTTTANYILYNRLRGHFAPPQTEQHNESPVEKNQSEFVNSQYCIQKAYRDFRPHPEDCSKFLMCSNNVLITYSCPTTTVYSADVKICVPKGSVYDHCRDTKPMTEVKPEPKPESFLPTGAPPQRNLAVACPRGVTYKKAHPVHCARYYDCSKPAMMDRWSDHEWECKYPFMFNEDTKRCEHYSMVDCGQRKVAYDKCDYKQFSCNGHAHCRPCEVSNPSCRGLKDGMNEWKGRSPSPYYVVCSEQRVVYSGSCSNGQLFDEITGTCTTH